MASPQACIRMQARDLRMDPSRAACTASLVRISTNNFTRARPGEVRDVFSGDQRRRYERLTYTNAGHLPPILVRGGKATFLDVNGTVVGAFAHAKYDESRLLLEPGDLLFGYTDGRTEAENEFGEMYGEQRLIDVLRQTSELEAPAIIQCVAEAVQKFTGTTELEDDMTMTIARRKA